MANEKCPVIVDCDPGTDDAWALVSLLKAEPYKHYKILGITCCSGNTTVDHSPINTLAILKLVNRMDIPVFAGSHSGFIDDIEYEFYFGRDGFGDTALAKPGREFVQEKHAVEALRDFILENSGKITLICLGPLTNIALLYKMYPETITKIKEIHMMGGNYQGVGNVAKSAEFNFWFDPEAAWIFLNKSKCPVFNMPFEVCTRASLNFPLQDYRMNVLSRNGNEIIVFLNKIEKKLFERTPNFWRSCDLYSAFCFIFPEAIKQIQTYHATVELAGKYTRGQMVLDHLKKEGDNINIIVEFDVELLKKFLQWICGQQKEFDF